MEIIDAKQADFIPLTSQSNFTSSVFNNAFIIYMNVSELLFSTPFHKQVLHPNNQHSFGVFVFRIVSMCAMDE